MLSESCTGYMYNMLVYYGKETLLTKTALNQVLTLMDPLGCLGYDLYTDHFYTSPILAHEILQINTGIRKDMPAVVKSNKQKIGDVDTYMKGKILVMQGTDKQMITTLTTKHPNSMVSIPSRLVRLNAHA